MPVFTWRALRQERIDPEHSSASGAAIRGSKIAGGRYLYPAGSAVTPHASPHEQILSIVRGRARWRVGGEEKVVGPGEAILIRADTEHSAEILEALEVIGFRDLRPAGKPAQPGRAFFTWTDLKSDFITPKYSSGRGPTIGGETLEVAFMFYPGGTEAKEHSHPNEQIQIGLKGRARYIIGGKAEVAGADGGALMPVNVLHSVEILEDYSVVNCKDIVEGFSVYDAAWKK